MIGSIKDDILNVEELALEVLKALHENYEGLLTSRYGIEEQENPVKMMEQIAEVRKCLSKGGDFDYLKTANIILEEFRNGKIGRVTLEYPLSEDVVE